ncbi:hypothetical protein BLOT_015983 [Blomia tropicalis]|nr:hypothetical protein BLOT_015983 [Blomia tropicalis]
MDGNISAGHSGLGVLGNDLLRNRSYSGDSVFPLKKNGDGLKEVSNRKSSMKKDISGGWTPSIDVKKEDDWIVKIVINRKPIQSNQH